MEKVPPFGPEKGADGGGIFGPLGSGKMGDIGESCGIIRQRLAGIHVFVDQEAINAVLESRQMTGRGAVFVNLPAYKFHAKQSCQTRAVEPAQEKPNWGMGETRFGNALIEGGN